MLQWFKDNVVAAFGGMTDKIAHQLSKDDDASFENASVKKAVPVVAAGVVGVTGLALMEPLTKLGRAMTNGVKSLVTGFGYFEKIPAIGGAFSFAGNMVDKFADYSGYALTTAASYLSYKMFQSKVTPLEVTSEEAPDRGTGAVGQEPEKIIIREKEVPSRPAEITPAPDAEALRRDKPEVAEMTYPMLRDMRLRSAADATRDPILEEQLRALMQEKNQLYENRRLFLKRVSEFDSGEAGSTRNNLVAILQAEGLSEREALTLVPERPQLRYTVTAGDKPDSEALDANGKPTDFAGKYEALDVLAKKLEGFYGVGYFAVSERDAEGGKNNIRIRYDDMSVTQKQEFIETALDHAYDQYTKLAPEVKSHTAVTSVNRAGGGSTTSWVTYGDLPKMSFTYHDQDGDRKVVSGKEEYGFLAGLNGDRIASNNYTSPNYMFHTSGERLDLGQQFTSLGNSFKGWQSLLDQHRQDLEIAATTYKGGISQYIEKVAMLDRSVKMIDKQKIALLAETQTSLTIKDLRTTPAQGGGKHYTLLGAWDNKSHTQFTVRGFQDEDGKEFALPASISLNLNEGGNFKDLIANMQSISGTRAAGAAALPILLEADRTESRGMLTVKDPNLGSFGGNNVHRFAGVFDDDKFTATGIIEPGKVKPIPDPPLSMLLPRKESHKYDMVGSKDDAVTSSYLYRGTSFREVHLKDPDGVEHTMVVEKTAEGYLVRELHENERPYREYAWYESGTHQPYTKPGREALIKGPYESGDKYHMFLVARTGLLLMDNEPIDLENAARVRRYKAEYPERDLLVVKPLTQQIEVADINNPAALQELVNSQRYHHGEVGEKTTTHEKDPFKTATHMMEITDKASARVKTRVIVHGSYDKEQDTFSVVGYELRPEGLAGDTPGRYVEFEESVMLDGKKTNYGAVYDHALKKMASMPAVETSLSAMLTDVQPRPPIAEAKDEVTFNGEEVIKGMFDMHSMQFTDTRKGKTSQPLNIGFIEDHQNPGNYMLVMLAHGEISNENMKKLNNIMPFPVDAYLEKEIMFTKEQIEELKKDPKKAAAFIDEYSSLASSGLTMQTLELKDSHVIIRVTDHQKPDKPTYDLVMVKALEGTQLQVVGYATPDSKEFTPVSAMTLDAQKIDEWKSVMNKIDAQAKGEKTAMITPSAQSLNEGELGALVNLGLPVAGNKPNKAQPSRNA